MKMKKYVGKKWVELNKEQQKEVLKNIVDCVSADGNSTKIGKCIVDFTDNVSICGELVEAGDYADLIIDDNSIFYDPTEGTI